VVVTDLGFAKRARQFAELMEAPLAIVEKRRHGNLDRAEVMTVIGEAIKRIHRGESVGALFSSEVSFTQEMLLWEDGLDGQGRSREAGPGEVGTAHGDDDVPSALAAPA
jgi:hypothetical protein